MFPLRAVLPSRQRPVITWLLIAANVVAFAYQRLATAVVGDGFVFDWGFVPARFLSAPLHDVPTLFSSMFLHGGLLHLIGNLWFLHVFGDAVETALGRARYLGFYLVAGLVAAMSQLVSDPSSAIPMIGASGAIAGVLGGYALRFPKSPVGIMTPLLFVIELPAFVVIGGWFAVQVAMGLGSLSHAEQGGVAFFAHAGGLIAGLAMMALVPRPRPKPTFVLRGSLDDWRPPGALR